MQDPKYRNIYGIFLMLLHSLAASILYAINKYLTGFISSNQVVFLYKLIVLIGILPWVFRDGISGLKTNKLKLHLMRGFVSTVAALCFFNGLSKVDIASATALNKMEPVLLMIIGVIYFKEKLTTPKLLTLLFSFLGMLFVIYPVVNLDENGNYSLMSLFSGFEEINYNYLIILCAVLLWTINSSVIKVLGKTESNKVQLFYVSLISVLVSLPTAMFSWSTQNINGVEILWINEVSPFANFDSTIMMLLIAVAFMHFIHVTCFFQSLKVGEMSIVIPFDYSRLIIGGMIGYYFFDAKPTLSSLIGYGLILTSGIYLLHIQTLNKRKKILVEQEQS